MNADNSFSAISEFFDATNPVGRFGKTSAAPCHMTEDGRLAPSSGAWRPSGIVSPGGSWTLDSGHPKVDREFSWSDIEVTTLDRLVPYLLSEKGKQYILRRTLQASQKGNGFGVVIVSSSVA